MRGDREMTSQNQNRRDKAKPPLHAAVVNAMSTGGVNTGRVQIVAPFWERPISYHPTATADASHLHLSGVCDRLSNGGCPNGRTARPKS
jgi:hypothetical protein